MIAKWTFAAVLATTISAAGMATAQNVAEQFNDYPTETRADYVFACMATNGQGADVLRRCSCSIDEIAAILPYEKYLQAETVLSMRRASGQRLSYFQGAPEAQDYVATLRRAQAEAEIVCF